MSATIPLKSVWFASAAFLQLGAERGKNAILADPWVIGRIEKSVDKWKGRSRCRKQRDWWHRHGNVTADTRMGLEVKKLLCSCESLVGPGSCLSSDSSSYDWSSLGAFKCALTFCGPAASSCSFKPHMFKKKKKSVTYSVLIFTWIFATSPLSVLPVFRWVCPSLLDSYLLHFISFQCIPNLEMFVLLLSQIHASNLL